MFDGPFFAFNSAGIADLSHCSKMRLMSSNSASFSFKSPHFAVYAQSVAWDVRTRATMRGSRSFAMKRILFTVSAIALALSAGTAFAADLPARKEAPVYVPPPPPPMWTGFYVGLNIGGGWDANGATSGYSAYYDPRYAIGAAPPPGFAAVGPNLFFLANGNTLGNAGGAQAGYNFQFNQFVIGAETDFQGSSMSGQGNSGFPTLFPTFYSNPANNYLPPVAALTGANINLA
jgi:outer membrane immunogenic protein